MKPNPLHSWLKSYWGMLGNPLERFLATLESCPVTIADKPAGTFESLYDVFELHPNQYKTFKQALQLEADTLQSFQKMGLHNYKSSGALKWQDRVAVVAQVQAWLELLEQGVSAEEMRQAWECTKKLMGQEDKPNPWDALHNSVRDFGLSAMKAGEALSLFKPRDVLPGRTGQIIPFPKKDDANSPSPGVVTKVFYETY